MRHLPYHVEAGMGRREPAASIDRGAARPVRRSTALGQAVYDVARGAAESVRASRRFSAAGRPLRSCGQVSQRIPEPEHLRGVRRLTRHPPLTNTLALRFHLIAALFFMKTKDLQLGKH